MKKLLFLFLFLLAGATASAQESFQKELFAMDLIMNHREDIELTDDQAKTMEKIYFDHIANFNAIKWNLGAEVRKMDKLLALANVNEESSLAQMKKVSVIEEQLKDLRLRMLIRIKNILTPAQQQRLKEVRTEQDINGLTLVTPINSAQKVMVRMGKKQFDGEEPLYVIKDSDGERVISKAYVQSLDPERIESIEILKFKPAIAKYGDKGKAGVVLIQVKDKD